MKWFGKSEPRKIIDRIFMSEQAKWAAMAELSKKDPQTVFIFWFGETAKKAQSFFETQNINPEIFEARQVNAHHITGKHFVFGEHYPLKTREDGLFQDLQCSEVIVYSALTEPIFKKFGGDSIIDLMHKLGMQENEMVEHAMISKSIRNAQEKLEKKIMLEHSANSAEDWFSKNVSPNP